MNPLSPNFSHLQFPVVGIVSEGARQTDYELAQSIGKGVTNGIGILYERHRSKVYALCLRMTGNAADAEDLTQEIFVQLLTKVSSFRGESQFSTWLHRFTTNHVLMYFRRKTRRRERFSSLADESISGSSLKCTFCAQVVDRISLDAAVALLPAGSRKIFLKFDVEGYNHEEIAGLIGCSIGNSKSQLHKARRKLRRLLRLNGVGSV